MSTTTRVNQRLRSGDETNVETKRNDGAATLSARRILGECGDRGSATVVLIHRPSIVHNMFWRCMQRSGDNEHPDGDIGHEHSVVAAVTADMHTPR